MGVSIIGIIAVIVFGISINSIPQEIEIEELSEKEIEIEELSEKEIEIQKYVIDEIQEKYDKIEKNNLDNQYTPQQREWIASGPFQIDRSEYVLGEKIFMRLSGLLPNEKGQIEFWRPINNTHYSTYISVPFDGMDKGGFNYYVQPQISKTRDICSANDIIGEWIIVFSGTQYSNLNFKIINQTIPGDERNYSKIVC